MSILRPYDLKLGTNPQLNSSSLFPVVVYIPGGALIVGGASDVTEEGAVRQFTSRGIVVATIQ